MRLVDFLCFLLQTQVESLLAMVEMAGRDATVQALEQAGPTSTGALPPKVRVQSKDTAGPSPFSQLEDAVSPFQLPEPLDFHVWGFPAYRAFIESSLDLEGKIDANDIPELTDSTVRAAKEWIENQAFPTDVRSKVVQAAAGPWLRFRAKILEKTGQNHVGAVT